MILPRKRRFIKKGACYFCKQKLTPDYKDLEAIQKFVSERGKILPRLISSVCQNHQRSLQAAVKRARYMAFLPYVVRPS